MPVIKSIPNEMSLKSNIYRIDAIFVNSVRTFTDRITHIENEFNKAKIDFRFVFEYDIPDIKESELTRYFIPDTHLSMGARSLLLKNIYIWQTCIKYDLKRILVIEDDAVLVKNFKEKLSKVLDEIITLAPGYYIFLGGAQSKIPPSFHTHNQLLYPLRGDTTEGYIIDIEGCKRLLSWINEHKLDLPVDGLINSISDEIGLKQYWSRTVLIEQGSLWGLFESSLDGKRRKRSKLENILRYRLVVFKRRKLFAWFYKIRFILFNF